MFHVSIYPLFYILQLWVVFDSTFPRRKFPTFPIAPTFWCLIFRLSIEKFCFLTVERSFTCKFSVWYYHNKQQSDALVCTWSKDKKLKALKSFSIKSTHYDFIKFLNPQNLRSSTYIHTSSNAKCDIRAFELCYITQKVVKLGDLENISTKKMNSIKHAKTREISENGRHIKIFWSKKIPCKSSFS